MARATRTRSTGVGRPAYAWARAAAGLAGALLLVLGIGATPASAQSQSINGTIEGTIVDTSGGVLPGVTVLIYNVDTGAERIVITNENGVYRAPLLPLGAYRVSAELEGFRKYEQTGIQVSAGSTIVINISLGVGSVTEVVSVTADAPIVDTGRIDQGRTLNEREIKTLPLTSRNPYNFALLQPGVVGFETQEYGVPRITANGALLRINYQVDGSNNTQKDRAGLRQMPMSEVMIREVRVITSGYAPEFGQTTGLIYNAITPSGTNLLRGQGSYRFQRKDFAAFPFFFQGPRTDDRKPPTKVDVLTFDMGGPIVRDRAHFFGGVERTERDLSGGRIITIDPANAARIGLAPQPAAMPTFAETTFAIGKVDLQLSQTHRLSTRYMFFDNAIANNVGGGLGSVERATDFADTQHSTAAQLISTFGANKLNELRVQYATRAQSRTPGSQAGTGPAINITGVANFGFPNAGAADAGFSFTQNVFQVVNNFSYIRENHSYKFGADVQWVDDGRVRSLQTLYTFPTIDAYLAARNGTNPRSYTSFQQFFGEQGLDYNSTLLGVFVQDDWRLTQDLKILYGVRWDVYNVPKADGNAPYAASRTFNVDKNNFAPRFGFVWTLGRDKRTVVRGNSGIMYDQVLLAMYEQALQNDGTDRRVTLSLAPTSAGAPAFPGNLANTPPGFVLPRQSIATVDPDFVIMRTWQNNLQVERGLGDKYSASVGFTFTKGYDLPTITNINPINPIGTLGDGRGIYSTAVNAATRLDPTFNNISMVQSIGESTYKALTAQLTRRFADGFQFALAYTLGKAEDNAPLTGTLSVQGDAGGRSDQTNLDFDKGPNVLDQRHTFTGSIVAQTDFPIDGALGAILNNNQFGIAVQLASGIPVNVRSNRELNNDGVASDRPIGVSRNSLSLPARKNVDLRYSRVFPLTGPVKLEALAEVKNIFNIVQVSGVNSVVQTDTLGNPLAPIPTKGGDFPVTGGYEQRQLQLGVRVTF
ncbi:MAG: TonB-dependent receptor [Acidobacteria bacterium]|nr:TonB-dependent receptor [Acidobacteriota bacterium]